MERIEQKEAELERENERVRKAQLEEEQQQNVETETEKPPTPPPPIIEPAKTTTDRNRTRSGSNSLKPSPFKMDHARTEIPAIPLHPGKNFVPAIFHPYEDLKRMKANKDYADDVNASVLHMYLSDEEFRLVFQCGKAEFEGLPVWKQKSKRQAAMIF